MTYRDQPTMELRFVERRNSPGTGVSMERMWIRVLQQKWYRNVGPVCREEWRDVPLSIEHTDTQ